MATLLVGPARPYTTIQAAINVTSATNDNPASRAAMDLILVDAGTYTEALDLRASWLLPVIIRGADPANRPVIASTGAAQAVRADSVYRGTAVGELTLEDLEFSGWTGAGNGVIYTTTSGLVVRRCKFTGCTSRVIRSVRGSATRYGIVDSCEFLTSGLTTGLILGDSAYTDVINCKAVCPTNVPFYYDLGGASRNIEHNSILGTWDSGGSTDVIRVTGGTARGNVVQNLGTGARYGIYEWGAGAYTENVVYGVFSTMFFGTDGGGNQNADPLFTNTATGDLTLQAGSPASRSLSRSPNTLLTILGASRSDPTDAGAYEMVLTTAVSAVTAVSGTSVKLDMSSVVASDSSWTTTGNYTITPPGGAPAITISAAVITDTDTITLTTNEHLQAGSYTLAWAGLLNITNGSSGYTGIGTAPVLSSAAAATYSTVTVTFSESMTNNAALTTAGNYTLTRSGGSTVVASVSRTNATVVVLTTATPLWSGYTYTLAASGPTDLAGNAVSAATTTFTPPTAVLASVTHATPTTVVLTFGPCALHASLDVAGNYTITWLTPFTPTAVTPTISSASAAQVGSTLVVTLTTTEHTNGSNYSVSWAGLTGVASSSSSYVGVGTAPTLPSVSVTSQTLIRLTFSEAMLATGLSTASNYTVAPTVAGGPAITVASATPGGGNSYVDLAISLGLAGKQYTVTAAATLTDVSLNPIGTRTANYTLAKTTMVSMTDTISTLVVTLGAIADPTSLTTVGSWAIARLSPLFGVTPTISSVVLNSASAPTTATLTTTNHTDGQAYRLSIISTTGVSAGYLDYVGEGLEATINVSGFYFTSTATIQVYVLSSLSWVSALLTSVTDDNTLTAVIPAQPAATVTTIRLSVGTRTVTYPYTYS